VYIEHNSKGYYAISKAYDYFGYSKKDFLQKVLIGIFVAIVLIVISISFYLSNIIAKPLSDLTEKMEEYDLSNEKSQPLKLKTSMSDYLSDVIAKPRYGMNEKVEEYDLSNEKSHPLKLKTSTSKL